MRRITPPTGLLALSCLYAQDHAEKDHPAATTAALPKSLDTREHLGPCDFEYREGQAIEPLALEQADESFAGDVVAAVSRRA